MVQGKMKKKTVLPKGVKAKIKKSKPQGAPRKGHALHIAPKRVGVISQTKISAEVTKIINDKNEEMIKNRADVAQGRASAATSKK